MRDPEATIVLSRVHQEDWVDIWAAQREDAADTTCQHEGRLVRAVLNKTDLSADWADRFDQAYALCSTEERTGRRTRDRLYSFALWLFERRSLERAPSFLVLEGGMSRVSS